MGLIAHTVGHASGGNYTTPAIVTTGAKLIVVIRSEDNANLVTVSDSKGNTWTERTVRVSTRHSLRIADCILPTSVGSGHTFTITGTSGGFGACVVLVFDDNVIGFDVENGFGQSTTGNTTIQPGSITPATSSLSVAGWGLDDPVNTTWTVDSGFTITDIFDDVPGSNYGCVGAYLDPNTGVVNPKFTRSNANTTGGDTAAIASYKISTANLGVTKGRGPLGARERRRRTKNASVPVTTPPVTPVPTRTLTGVGI